VCGPEGIDLAVVPDAIWVRDADETVEDFIRRVRREAREAGFASFEVRGRYNTDEDEAPQGIREAA
jgi:hypothetical protein